MLTIPPNTRISLCTTPVDMRKSFKGLLGVVRNTLDADPVADHLFVFLNRCGKLFDGIGEDRSERLHFKPMELYVVVQRLKKSMASCRCSDKRSATAESPIRPIDKGIASTSLLSMIAVMKYLDHLPLARQATQLFRRSGVELSQSSMCRWMGNIAELLFPLYKLMHEKLLESSVLQVDATAAKFIDPSNSSHRSTLRRITCRRRRSVVGRTVAASSTIHGS